MNFSYELSKGSTDFDAQLGSSLSLSDMQQALVDMVFVHAQHICWALSGEVGKTQSKLQGL
ncbi:hypothetical protein D3C72_2268440 [compost metagenome]